MTSQGWVLPLLVVIVRTTVLVSAARLPNQESLRGALDAVNAWKQRSLDAADVAPEYYNDLYSTFKYRDNDAGRKFDRNFGENDEDIEFLPGDNSRLEMGESLQNDKLLERALLDYLENLPEREQPAPSIFRERERSGSHKRGGVGDRSDKFSLEELQEVPPYDPYTNDSHFLFDAKNMNEHLDGITQQQLQALFDRYFSDDRENNKMYEMIGPMSWGEAIGRNPVQPRDDTNDDFLDQNQGALYLPPEERRNVNGRYPIGREFGTYSKLTKRYPVAKRSALVMFGPSPSKPSKTTDPKVAQDLGALFGTQTTDIPTHAQDNEHKHDHDHDHDHNHEHNQDHDHESSSKAPLEVTPSSKGQKENVTKTDKSKFLQVRKKSIDWSQYFGIDRRKKKATFVAEGQGTQNRDDEWMLQRYYENMAENLKPKEDENERRDKLEQIDSKLDYIKSLIIEEALKYANLEEADLEKAKEKLMTRMATAYLLQKMRKAQDDLRENIAAQKEARLKKENQNETSNFCKDDSNKPTDDHKTNDKRNNVKNTIEDVVEESRSCPELENIEWRCRTVDRLAGDTSRMLYVPCVKLQICKACAQDEEALLPCLANYAVEVSKVCDTLDGREEEPARLSTATRENEKLPCANVALLLSQLKPSTATSIQCRAQNGHESCLRRYHARYEHRYFHTSPVYGETSGSRGTHHADTLDALQQTMR